METEQEALVLLVNFYYGFLLENYFLIKKDLQKDLQKDHM